MNKNNYKETKKETWMIYGEPHNEVSESAKRGEPSCPKGEPYLPKSAQNLREIKETWFRLF